MFDLEGTLVLSGWQDPKYVEEFRKMTKNKLIELGIPRGILEGVKRSTMMRNTASDYVERVFTAKKAKQFYSKMEHFLRKYELLAAKRSRIFPETIATLTRLRSFGFKLGLITNTSKEVADLIISKHGLQSFFEVIVTREDVKRLKPDPEGILLAIKYLGESIFFFVGDESYDALAAKNAGGLSILVKRSLSRNDEPFSDFKVTSLNGIIPHIVRHAR